MNYAKKSFYTIGNSKSLGWKTFVKTGHNKITAYSTTDQEFLQANIPQPKTTSSTRSPASVQLEIKKGFMMRNNRILMGEIEAKYEDHDVDLPMINSLSPNWKETMGHNLMRFQDEETKLFVKEELPVINIEDGKGRFLEQVLVTYLSKDGNKSSFKALVDSETGALVETWDRTIHEKLQAKNKKILNFSTSVNNGIIGK